MGISTQSPVSIYQENFLTKSDSEKSKAVLIKRHTYQNSADIIPSNSKIMPAFSPIMIRDGF